MNWKELCLQCPNAFRLFLEYTQQIDVLQRYVPQNELLHEFFLSQHIIVNLLGIFRKGTTVYAFNIQTAANPEDVSPQYIDQMFDTHQQALEKAFQAAFEELEQITEVTAQRRPA